MDTEILNLRPSQSGSFGSSRGWVQAATWGLTLIQRSSVDSRKWEIHGNFISYMQSWYFCPWLQNPQEEHIIFMPNSVAYAAGPLQVHRRCCRTAKLTAGSFMTTFSAPKMVLVDSKLEISHAFRDRHRIGRNVAKRCQNAQGTLRRT